MRIVKSLQNQGQINFLHRFGFSFSHKVVKNGQIAAIGIQGQDGSPLLHRQIGGKSIYGPAKIQ